MSQARFIVGDVLEVLRSMPDDSVDLVLTSPPFLALRSYLPADHPDKGKELGSEPTPGAFIDALLDVVEECRRVLAPHGSLCIELGDTYAGSGGAGGDYGENGLREGQPVFRQGRAQGHGNRSDIVADTLAGIAPAARSSALARRHGGWPQDKSLTLVPELFRIALAYGVNPLTGRTTEPWRIRNVVRHFRPNPPVGSLGDKWRPATSDWAVACTAGKGRYFDIDAVRVPGNPENYRGTKASNGKSDRDTLRQENVGGRPPYDWHPVEEWEDDLEWKDGAGIVLPTHGFPGAHYATFSPKLVQRFVECMTPERVCRVCGEPSRRVVESERLINGEPTDEAQRRPSATVEALAVSGGGTDAPLGFMRSYGTRRETLGWTECGCPDPFVDEENRYLHWRNGVVPKWRPGVVLDCFGGSGTTAAVSTGHGRNCVLVDLDERNAELATARCGMFLDVAHYADDGSHLPHWLSSPRTHNNQGAA